ncbi:hypothetical protein VRB95_08420 [Erwinia aphidicola]|uniref:hypothetical protein n=1 Tax=Erwinia aphidicola TaxID=68334 RepID=UPI0030D46C62
MKEVEVKRDEMGFWTHPEYFDGDEGTTKQEFQAWQDVNAVETFTLGLCDDYDQREFGDKYSSGDFGGDVSGWNPSRPCGDGWFIGSIHDTEDGPYCIWLRNKQQAA